MFTKSYLSRRLDPAGSWWPRREGWRPVFYFLKKIKIRENEIIFLRFYYLEAVDGVDVVNWTDESRAGLKLFCWNFKIITLIHFPKKIIKKPFSPFRAPRRSPGRVRWSDARGTRSWALGPPARSLAAPGASPAWVRRKGKKLVN